MENIVYPMEAANMYGRPHRMVLAPKQAVQVLVVQAAARARLAQRLQEPMRSAAPSRIGVV